MKKYNLIICMIFVFMAFASQQLFARELVIRENFFITQTDYIYKNQKSYVGTVIKYEGIFDVFENKDKNGKTIKQFVFRYGPGCCGPDAYAGFEVVWDKPYPKKNDWVEVVGILEEYEYEHEKILRVKLTSLTVLEKRGKEIVTR